MLLLLLGFTSATRRRLCCFIDFDQPSKATARPLGKDHSRTYFIKCNFVAGDKECDAKSIDEPKSLREEKQYSRDSAPFHHAQCDL